MNVILVCSCRFWTFQSFHHTCGEWYRSLHFGICLQFTEIHQRVLTCRRSSVQAHVVTRQRVAAEAQVGSLSMSCVTVAVSFSWYIDFTLPIISPPLLHIHLSPEADVEYSHRTATALNALKLHAYKHMIISSFFEASLVRCVLYIWTPKWFDSQYCHYSEGNKIRVSNVCRINTVQNRSPGTTWIT